MVVNRIGDLGIALGMGLIYLYFKTLNFNVFLPLVPFYHESFFNFFNYQFNCIDVISILIFIGAVGKSAQLGLHV
jgi:NADH-quinone oxidoreductase subunit L